MNWYLLRLDALHALRLVALRLTGASPATRWAMRRYYRVALER